MDGLKGIEYRRIGDQRDEGEEVKRVKRSRVHRTEDGMGRVETEREDINKDDG